ncbi:hypothetical protein ACJBPR_00490 [Streptococcus suis]
MIDWIKNWEKVGVVGSYSNQQVQKLDGNKMILLKDMSDDDSFVDKLIYQYHDEYNDGNFQYQKIKEFLEEHPKNSNNPLEIYISYDNWEQERNVVEALKTKEKSGIQKNRIENDFAVFNSIYFSEVSNVTLNVEQEGINYLTSPSCVSVEEEEITGTVINCSFLELKKLYNVTGTELFKRNVRNGIVDNKSLIRSVFSNYLSVDGDYVIDTEDVETMEKDLKYDDYDPTLFWFSHNGITLFIDKSIAGAYDFQNDSITINPKACSVINGAQTITNFFLVYSELRHDLQKKDYQDALDQLETLLSKIFVKLTIISGKGEYAPFITKGLNTQNPITQEDFVAISKEVIEINKLARGYFYILKSGEVKRVGGLTPLQFVKQYFIVQSKPGSGKNFNKKDLEKQIKIFYEELSKKSTEDRKNILEKMTLLPAIEDWWNKNNAGKFIKKGIVENYGKNYFQSFVLDNYSSFIDNDDELASIFEKFKELLESKDLDYNEFKKDDLYEKKLRGYFEKNKVDGTYENNVSDVDEQREYEKNLLAFLSEIDKQRIHYRTEILKFNESKNIMVDNPRIIRRDKGEVKENFHLPTKSFKELYQNLNIEEKLQEGNGDITIEDFKKFEDSTLYEELKKKYNFIILDFCDGDLKKVTLKKDFDLQLLEKYQTEVKKSYENTITAFMEGDKSKFPKANKDTKVHVRPKALRKDDSFMFTSGEMLTKRTFWVTRYYLNELLDEAIN